MHCKMTQRHSLRVGAAQRPACLFPSLNVRNSSGVSAVSRRSVEALNSQEHPQPKSSTASSLEDQQHPVEPQHLQVQQQHLALSKAEHNLKSALAKKTGLPPLQRALQPVLHTIEPVKQVVAAALNKFDPRVRGLILLNAMTLIMGSNWVVVKESNDAFDPMTFTCLRFTLAAAAFAPFLIQGLQDKRVRNAGLEVGLWTALGYLAQSWALFLTPASRASLLSTFTVIAVPCLAGLTGERVKPLVWACGLAALVGTTLLEQGASEPANVGDLLSILSALFFAMQLFRTEKTSRELPEGSNLPYMSIILATVAAASCASAVAVHWQDAAAAVRNLQHVLYGALDALGPSDSPVSGAQPLFQLMYTSFCSTDLVLLIELVALQTVSSTEAALIYSLEPVSGAAMAYAFLGERWGPMGWVGAVVILSASIACQLGGAADADGTKAASSSCDETAGKPLS